MSVFSLLGMNPFSLHSRIVSFMFNISFIIFNMYNLFISLLPLHIQSNSSVILSFSFKFKTSSLIIFCKHTHIYKSPVSVQCCPHVYVFKNDHFRADNLLGGLYLEKTDSPSFNTSLSGGFLQNFTIWIGISIDIFILQVYYFLPSIDLRFYDYNFHVIYGSHYLLPQISWSLESYTQVEIFPLAVGKHITGSREPAPTGMISIVNEAKSWQTHLYALKYVGFLYYVVKN